MTEINCSLIRFVSSMDRPIHHVMEMDKDVTFDFGATAITRMASSSTAGFPSSSPSSSDSPKNTYQIDQKMFHSFSFYILVNILFLKSNIY